VVGGYLSNSLAIMTDAAHLFSDFASFGISLVAIWLSGRQPKKAYNYGYFRAEALGALFTVILVRN
jgi:zinc transporter 2